MITKILSQDIDKHSMPPQHTVFPITGEKQDYKNVVVDKPWGYEYLMFENEHVAIWVLFLKERAKTSMHCHPKKLTSLIVLEGEVRTSSLGEKFDLKKLDGIIIDKGVFHSTSTDFGVGAFVMEIETPPEKADLVRINDQYGRENKGYESGPSISRDLEKYEHFGFHEPIDVERKIVEKVIKKSKVVLHTQEEWETLLHEIEVKDFCVLSFLDTFLVDSKGEIVVGVGEIFERDWFLKNYHDLKPGVGKFTVLTIY